jgi:hypothetical protein
MNLMALYSTLRRKGFHYSEGRTNDKEDYLCIQFSTGYNGRGNAAEITIRGDEIDVEYWLYDYTKSTPTRTHKFYEKIEENKALKILEDELS